MSKAATQHHNPYNYHRSHNVKVQEAQCSDAMSSTGTLAQFKRSERFNNCNATAYQRLLAQYLYRVFYPVRSMLCDSKGGPWTSSTGIAWGLARNAESEAPPQEY